MISKHTHAKIQRLFFRDNISIHVIAQKVSLSIPTVRKWLHVPSGTEIKFHRTPPEKLIKPFEPWLLQALKVDSPQPKRDRRTAMALFEEIRKQGFTGSYSRVTEYVSNWREHGGFAVAKSTPSEDMQHWMMWLYSLEQPHRSHSGSETSVNINKLYGVLTPSPNSPRAKALVVLAKLEGFSVSQIARHLAISRPTVRGYLSDFVSSGEKGLFKGKTKARKSQNPDLKKCIFTLLHEPPSLHGFNRTTWRMVDLRKALNNYSQSACDQVIREVIKDAGYRWKSAKVVLTSTDPEYPRWPVKIPQ